MIDSSVIYDIVTKKSSISFSDKEISILKRLVLTECSSTCFNPAVTSDRESFHDLCSLFDRFSLALKHE